MLGRRILVLTLAALFVSGGATVLVAAQDTGSGDTPSVSHGYIYLTGEEVDQVAAPGDELCHQQDYVPYYGTDLSVPLAGTPEKAQAGRAGVTLSCATHFRHEVTRGLTLNPETTLTFWLYCDTPFPAAHNPLEGLIDYRILLLRNDQEIHRHEGNYPFAPAEICPGEATNSVVHPAPPRFDAVLGMSPTFLATGDELTIEVVFFGYADATQSLHFLVNGWSYPSALHGPGFPGMMRSHLHGDLAVDLRETKASAGPGNATVYTANLTNHGVSGRDVRFTVEGPAEGWRVTSLDPSFHLASNATREARFSVVAPADAVVGQKVDHHVTVESEGEEITFTATTQVVPGTGTPAEPAPPDGDPRDDLVVTEAPAGEATSLKGTLLGVWQELIATLVVASIAGVVALLRG